MSEKIKLEGREISADNFSILVERLARISLIATACVESEDTTTEDLIELLSQIRDLGIDALMHTGISPEENEQAAQHIFRAMSQSK